LGKSNLAYIRDKLAKEVYEYQEYLMARSHIDFSAYVELTNPGWIKGKHLAYVCDTVQNFLEGNLHSSLGAAKLLIISMPPQSGKSTAVTETLPSWFAGKNPNGKVVSLAYGDNLALRFGRRNREKLTEWGEVIWGIRISKVKSGAGDIEIEDRLGRLLSSGYKGGVTGNPADLIIIDDPIKNREQADSETYRESLWEEFNNTILSRLSASGKIILIMTRWHEDDLAGRLIRTNILPTYVINIPCEAEENDILGREPGDSIFPEIGKDKEWLKMIKHAYLSGENADADEMGSGIRTWNALYQGRPVALEGNMIKREWWNWYEKLPSEFDDAVISVDCAFKGNEQSDYVVLQAWGKLGNDFYLVDQLRDRMDFTETLKAIRAFVSRNPEFRTVLVEDKANGPAVINTLQKEIVGIVPFEPKGSKESRVSSVTPAIESGHCYLPKYRTFANEFVEECAAFPNGKNDDMVDAAVQALIRLYFKGGKYRKIKPKGGTDTPKGAFYTPSELDGFHKRHNNFTGGFQRPGKVGKNDRVKLNLHV
jgi:predicted phage terminase large subunit-like protein